MKNKRIFKTFSALCAALVLMMGLSVFCLPRNGRTSAEDATNDSNVVVESRDSPTPDPDGKRRLVDDFGDNKQLITVTTRQSSCFILIDRANGTRKPLSTS